MGEAEADEEGVTGRRRPPPRRRSGGTRFPPPRGWASNTPSGPPPPLEPPLGVLGVGDETQLAQQSPQLTGGEVTGTVGDVGHYLPPRLYGQVGGAVSQHPGLTPIDPTFAQHLTDLREPLCHIMSESDLVLSSGPGQPQRRPHLQGGELPREVVVTAASRHLGDIGGPFRLQVRRHPVPGDHQAHHVVI